MTKAKNHYEHTCYMQVQNSIVRSQAVFHQHSHSEYAHVLVNMLDPIFCWAEISIWNSNAISKIHLNEGSLKVSLWWQKRERVKIDSDFFFYIFILFFFWKRSPGTSVWYYQRKGGNFINLLIRQWRESDSSWGWLGCTVKEILSKMCSVALLF